MKKSRCHHCHHVEDSPCQTWDKAWPMLSHEQLVRGLCHAKAGQTTAKNVLISQNHSAPPPGPRRRIDACQTNNLVVYSCRLSSLPVAPPTPPASTRQLQERKESAAALPSIRELLHSKHRTYALHEKQEKGEEHEERAGVCVCVHVCVCVIGVPVIDPGTVTIPQYRFNKTKQHTLSPC